MNELILYLIKNGVALLVFYIIYRIFLQKESFFILNRIYLIGSIIFSALIPLVSINLPTSSNTVPYIILNAINIGELGIENAIRSQLSGWEIMLIIYFAAVGILLIRFFIQIAYFFITLKRYSINRQFNSRIIPTENNSSPFSFFGFIFINKDLFNPSDVEKIISHEKVHVKQLHSIDLILIEFTCILQWFNPVVWFYKRSIKEIHEYLADEGVLDQGYERSAYQKLILDQVSSISSMELANNFSYSLIKRRFQMMKKIKSRKRSFFKFLLALPAIGFGMLSVASYSFSPGISTSNPDPPEININNLVIPGKGDDTIYKVVHKPPSYIGGDFARQEFLVKSIKYPEKARKNGVSGTVFASFIIEKDGSVTNPEIIRGIGGGCDEEVIRILKLMPKWNPGEDKAGNAVRVSFAIPVKFNLNSEKKEDNSKK